MVLAGHIYASYLWEYKAFSCVGGHSPLSNNSSDPPNNGAVLNVSQIIKAIMSSATKAEIGTLYINCREAIPARHILIVMGHPQPPMPMQTDNTTALGFVNNTIDPQRTKDMDMRFHWLQCHKRQQQFLHYWRPGQTNNGDYITKHHAAVHLRAMRTEFFTPKRTLVNLRQRARALITRSTARVF